MSGPVQEFDVVVIGSGPAGQKAAVQAAKAGRRVLVIERERQAGGECVLHGTIPSKTLRDTAVRFAGLRERLHLQLPENVQVAALSRHLETVIAAHQRFMGVQLQRNGIELRHGRARFLSAHEVEVSGVRGERSVVRAEAIVVAVGSRPRTPREVPVDHEHVLDSDSILSLVYLPRSLTVLGAGVIACEYASIFAALGVAVTMIDKGARPLAFLDQELTAGFQAQFERNAGCRFLGERKLASVRFDGVAEVVTELTTGEVVRSEKLLCALGREANLQGLAIEQAGLAANARGLLDVDPQLRTRVPHIYAVGDVIGPPSLAATAMEQGRRAMRHWLGMAVENAIELVPIGIYTIPEISCVGLSEEQARAQRGGAIVGRASFAELARGQIASVTDGVLKLVADAEGRELLGAQILGEGATELIHVAQVAMLGGMRVDAFVDHVFNFPTLAEAYRVAALDVVRQRAPAAAAR